MVPGINNTDPLSVVTDEILNGPKAIPLLDPAAAGDALDAAAEAKQKAKEAGAIAQEAANQAVLAGGPGFVFNEEQINTVIHQLDDVILPALKDARKKATGVLNNIQPPGDEIVSITYVNYANQSGNSYLKYLNDEIEKIQEKSDAFKLARDKYLSQDQESKVLLNGHQ